MPHTLDISVVSHGHGDVVLHSLQSLTIVLGEHKETARIFLTLNVPEPVLEQAVMARMWPFKLELIRNKVSQGFGANHNQAFSIAQQSGGGKWFAVVNPDIVWSPDATAFWSALETEVVDERMGLVCPQQVDRHGNMQDYARPRITILQLLHRLGNRVLKWPRSAELHSVESADWVNGACMIFRSSVFAQLGGFDERYYMYCEDLDICLRLQLAGWKMSGVDYAVVHDAQRNTRRSLRHLYWHVSGLLRLWISRAYWRHLLLCNTD